MIAPRLSSSQLNDADIARCLAASRAGLDKIAAHRLAFVGAEH